MGRDRTVASGPTADATAPASEHLFLRPASIVDVPRAPNVGDPILEASDVAVPDSRDLARGANREHRWIGVDEVELAAKAARRD